jgi:hypothetical protein
MKANAGGRPATTHDLLPSERAFLDAMHHLGYGRYELLRIERGELVLDPWPITIRQVRFGSANPGSENECRAEFRLKDQVAELFEHVRSVDDGEILVLEIRGGLPFAMQFVQPAGESRFADQASEVTP